jgi:hypothetical protein
MVVAAAQDESAATAMLLDRLMPHYDATRVDHRVVDGSPDRVYQAALHADFAEAFTCNRAARALVAVRSVIERGIAALRPGLADRDPAPVSEMTLAGMDTRGQYVLLGEDPPREIAFGMIGRFWAGQTHWEEFDVSEFEGFTRPGLARIACSLSFRPYGARRTLVSYETRTQATDERARRAFLRYWRVAGPLAGVVLRAQLEVIARKTGG